MGYIIGNKKDLGENLAVDNKEAVNLATDLELGYIETSARTGENVDNAFYIIAKMLYNSINEMT